MHLAHKLGWPTCWACCALSPISFVHAAPEGVDAPHIFLCLLQVMNPNPKFEAVESVRRREAPQIQIIPKEGAAASRKLLTLPILHIYKLLAFLSIGCLKQSNSFGNAQEGLLTTLTTTGALIMHHSTAALLT